MTERRDGGEELEAVVVDPICGEPVLAGDPATVTLRYAGRGWHFCSDACRARFAQAAERALLAEALRAGRLLSHRGRARWGSA